MLSYLKSDSFKKQASYKMDINAFRAKNAHYMHKLLTEKIANDI